MHNGMLELGSEKMAKSVGNIAPLHEVIDRYGRDAVVLFFCGAHYRQPIDFGPDPLEQARANVARLREVARKLLDEPSPVELTPLRERFFERLADDFNTPRALAEMWEWVREANRRDGAVGGADLREMLGVLGLANLLDVSSATAPTAVLELARARQAAREAGDFGLADKLRAQIEAAGWRIRDVGAGFELLPADG